MWRSPRAGAAAAGKNGTAWTATPSSTWGVIGRAERLASCPFGPSSKCMAWIGRFERRRSSQPSAAPSACATPSAVTVLAPPGGTRTLVSHPPVPPLASMPRTTTAAGSDPGLITRSRLPWPASSGGRNSAVRRSPSTFRRRSWMLASAPFALRTWASTRIASTDVSASRQSPSGGPTPTGSPFAALPCCTSRALSCTVCRAPIASATGPNVRPPSSVASSSTSPPRSSRLTTRTRPSRPGVSA